MGRWADAVIATGGGARKLIELGAEGHEQLVLLSASPQRASRVLDLVLGLPMHRSTVLVVSPVPDPQPCDVVALKPDPRLSVIRLRAPSTDGRAWAVALDDAARVLAPFAVGGSVVVDIDGFPAATACLLLGGLLRLEQAGRFGGELQVLAGTGRPAQAPQLPAPHLHAIPPVAPPAPTSRTLWIPVLMEGRRSEFLELMHQVAPDEVCPVLPFPSWNPRRGDDLVLEYHDLLVVHPPTTRTVLYCRESDPLDLYRILEVIQGRYRGIATSDADPAVVVSPGPDPWLALGALMASLEFDLHLAFPATTGDAGGYAAAEDCPRAMSCWWLAGAPYRPIARAGAAEVVT